VQCRERWIWRDRRRSNYPLGQARKAEQPCRHPGRPVQEGSTLSFRRPRQHRLDQLANHPEGEFALQLGPARPQHPEALALSSIAAGRQQCRLADPRRPFDDERASLAPLGLLQTPPDYRQLSIALQQDATELSLAPHHRPR
jgi:hypothetical protein